VEDSETRAGGLLRGARRPLGALRAVPHIATYAGMALLVAGGALLVLTWVRVAALTNVGLQMPYVISAGVTGLALIAVGLTVINLSAKASDAALRRAQSGELRDLLAELRQIVEREQ
jgi:hypothetical protein